MKKLHLFLFCVLSTFAVKAQDYLISGPSLVQTCGGFFYDNGGPNGNHNSADYIQTYTSANGDRLRFDFSLWSVGQHSKLRVYDGPNASYPLIGLYDYFGSTPGIIESTGTTLYFDFDGFSYGLGWEAAISCIPPVPLISMQSLSVDTLCEGVIFDSGGASGNYGNNEDMVTVIKPLTPNDYLSVDFPTRFSLGAGDTLFVYNGSVANGDLLGVYLGYNQHETIVSRHPGESLSFHFKSDGAGTAQGWQGEISCSTQPPVAQYTMGSGTRYFACGGQFYDDGGEFWDYRNIQDKTLTLVSNTGCHIGLDFTQWAMYTYDEIFVYDGTSITDPLLGHFVHYTPNPTIVTATGTAITIRFESTVSNNGPGWAANIFCGAGSNPQISLNQGSLTSCIGDTVALSVPGSASYLWNTGEVSPNLSVTTSGAYSATLTDSTGCVKITDTVDVVFNPVPAVPTVSASGPLEFCQGGSVTLNASNENAYLWNTGATSQQITPNSSGFYDVTVYNQFNCSATSNQTEVIVNPAPNTPTISTSGPLEFCQGGSVTLNSSNESAYLWNTGATTSQITANSSGLFGVTVYNQFNCPATSAPIEVIVNPLPNTPTISTSGPLEFCQGGSVTLNASNENAYLWNTGATSQQITPNSSGFYDVTVYNQFNCSATSNQTEVIVNPLPSTPTINASGPLQFCQGDSVILTSSVEDAYLWSTGAVNNQITASNPGFYDVTVYNQFNCAATSVPTEVIVNALPPTPTITENGQVLTSSAPSGNQWYQDGVLIPGATNSTFTFMDNGDYTVIATVDGCSSESSVPYIIEGLSVNDIEQLQLSVYPNPTSGNLTVASSLQITQIKLYSMQGQLMLEQNEGFSHINLTAFAKGIYWLQITAGNKQYKRKVVLR